MRGSLRDGIDSSVMLGIIPAHAGLTASKWWVSYLGRDHPRACGAHPPFSGENTFAVGSSPRMRGSLGTIITTHGKTGIIPAHAGLTRVLQR